MANTVSFIINLQDKFSSKLGKAAAAVRKFDKTTSKLPKSLATVKDQLIGFASAAAIGTALVKTVQGITQFETALVGVGKTTGLAGAQLKALGDSVLLTSKQLQTISSDKLLELAQVAGQLGIKGEESILKFATVLAKLEGASDIKGEEGAASIARLLTITGEGVGIVDRFAASLVGLGNNSAATESEILAVASEVARSTAAFKLSSSEILGISTALKSLDVAPEAAGTAIAQVFRGIELATINGGEKLQNFAKIMGQTTASVKENFAKAPLESFETFIKGLNRVSNEGGSLTKSLQDVGLSGLIVSKGIVPLATNFDLLHDKLALANKGFMENTAVNEEFAASQKTVQSALNAVGIAFQNVFIKAATSGSALGSLQDALFFISANMETIIPIVGALAGAFLTFKTVMFAVTSATKIWTAAQIAFNIAMNLNPISLTVIAIAALVAGIVLAFNHFEGFRNVVIAIAGVFLALHRVLMAQLMPVFNVLVAVLKVMGNHMMVIGGLIIDSLVQPFNIAKDAIGGVIDFMIGKVTQFLGFLAKIPVVGKAIGDIKKLLGDVPDAAINVSTNQVKAAQDPFAKGSIKAPAGATTGAAADVAGAGTTVKSAAPKVFNLQIGSLIQEVNITKTTTTESITEFTNMLKESLLGTLNDVQTELA